MSRLSKTEVAAHLREEGSWCLNHAPAERRFNEIADMVLGGRSFTSIVTLLREEAPAWSDHDVSRRMIRCAKQIEARKLYLP